MKAANCGKGRLTPAIKRLLHTQLGPMTRLEYKHHFHRTNKPELNITSIKTLLWQSAALALLGGLWNPKFYYYRIVITQSSYILIIKHYTRLEILGQGLADEKVIILPRSIASAVTVCLNKVTKKWCKAVLQFEVF